MQSQGGRSRQTDGGPAQGGVTTPEESAPNPDAGAPDPSQAPASPGARPEPWQRSGSPTGPFGLQPPQAPPGWIPDPRLYGPGPGRPWHRQGWFWLIVVVVALGVIVALGLAALGAMHSLVSATSTQTAAMRQQTQALTGINATLHSIADALQTITRQLAQLIGLAGAHTGAASGAAAGPSTSATAATATP